LALSLIDVLKGDNGLDVCTQLVMEGMAEWEVWNVEEEDKTEGYEGAVRKAMKYSSQSKSGLAIQEDTMKRLLEDLNGKEDDEDREAKARCWTRERELEEISIKRADREKVGVDFGC
jgi:hypothetical protein